jgi:multiple sugar transport system ATP-binding protein
MASVSIGGLSKHYGTVQVLKDVSIDVEDGSFVALVGPSGCGKSTLLRTIAGLEDFSAGEIRIGGETVHHLRPMDRDIAMVFQSYALYPQMTVQQNMAFSLKLKKVSKSEATERVARAASILGLSDLLDRYPRQLSGGQRQRVAMGRAIVRDPKVFLFDEPLSNLDAKLRVQMRAEIKELHQKLGTTMIYVTHDQVEAMTMADEIVVLRDGRVEQSGPPLELFDRPRNTFVAGFIGSPSMNLLPGRKAEGGFRLTDGTLLPVEAPDRAEVIGFRPDQLELSEDGAALQVTVTEPMGTETQVIGRIGGQPVTAIFRERLDLPSGSTIQIAWQSRHSHWFDAEGMTLA